LQGSSHYAWVRVKAGGQSTQALPWQCCRCHCRVLLIASSSSRSSISRSKKLVAPQYCQVGPGQGRGAINSSLALVVVTSQIVAIAVLKSRQCTVATSIVLPTPECCHCRVEVACLTIVLSVWIQVKAEGQSTQALPWLCCRCHCRVLLLASSSSIRE
jgi:hypothetical protein